MPETYIASLQRWLADRASTRRARASSESSDEHVIRHVLIRGRVQGVGFRAWTEYTALERGLEGWVRNRRDGAVEAVFAGAGRKPSPQ